MGFGVAHPFALTPYEMSKLLVLTRFDDEDHPSANASTRRRRFRSSCKKVSTARIVSSDEKGRLSASADWAPWLTLEAHRERKLDGFERVLRAHLTHDSLPRYHYRDSRAERRSRQLEEMTLRCRTVAERFSELGWGEGQTGAGMWKWLVRPGVGHLLPVLPPGCADAALAECPPEVVSRASAPDPVLEAYSAGSIDLTRHADAVAFIHILRGEPDAALGVYADLAPEDRRSKAARVGLASIRAVLATLRGDDAEAARRIREAIAAERAGTRRRNVFPVPPAFALSLLSLVRSRAAGDSELLDHLLRVGAKKRGVHVSLLRAVVLADHARQGLPLEYDTDRRTGPSAVSSMDRFVDGLAGCWQGAGPALAGSDRLRGLDAFGIRAVENGYRWLAAECMEVSARLREAAGLSGAAPARRYTHSRPRPPAAAQEAAAGVHRELGTTTLASLVTPMPKWERILVGVEKLAEEAREKRPGSATPGPDRRLSWTLGVDSHPYRIAATVRDQRRHANGKWSKGRLVALKRLAAEADGMRFLLDQDREAAARIVQEEDRWGRSGRYVLSLSGIVTLQGHPHLYSAAGDPLEVVEREPELRVVEEDGMLRARVEPHTDEAVDDEYGVVTAGDGRIEVTRFTAAQRRLCGAIPLEGVRLPLESRDRLVEAVTALAADVRVQGAFAVETRAAKKVEGDPRPLVRLERSGQGLAVALLVEPVGDSGAYFTPGTGGTTALLTVDGQAVQAHRDLVAERRAARELTDACPALSLLGPDGTATVSDLAECLEIVDQLQAADARCLWPKGQPFRVAARADAGSLRLSGRSAAEWFGVSGSLQLDGVDAIELRELFELLDRSPGSRFVPMEDGSFLALTEGFRRQLEDLRSISANRGRKQVRVHGLAALALADLFDRTRLSADRAWRSLRRRFESAGTYEPRTPPTLRAELRPYQEEGFRWLARLSRWGAGACLADDMGLGKTVQTLALLLERATDGPALVVVPTSVVSNWIDEARRFAPTLNPIPYTGPVAARAGMLESLGPFDLAVTTYGLLHNDVDDLAAVEWSTVVLDEAQAIKNPATQRARAARRLPARFRIVTTGTPIQNNVLDLYSLFHFLNPGLLGSARRFRENFALPVERDRDPEARHRLRRLIRPFVLRRLKSDVLDDLPPRTEITLHVELSAEEAALYGALRQRAMDDLEALARSDPEAEGAGEGRMRVLAHLTRLRLSCCHPRLVHPDGPPSSKLKTFAATLDELRQGGHRVLVFSQFVRHLKLIAEYLEEAGIAFQYLDGSTPARARAERIAAFQAGEGDAFLISLKAGGVGLNLTAADYVIHMDPWWNPAAEDQASDRAHRIGQTRPVTVYRLVARGTIEEQIVELHRSKRALADRLLEGADAPGRLNTEELLALLRG